MHHMNDEPEYQGPQKSEGVHGENRPLLDDMSRVQDMFTQAFRWSEDTTTQLFDRIAGASGAVPGELRELLIDLYLKGQESSFIQDEHRGAYKQILGAFAREGKDIQVIRSELVECGQIDVSADDLYVTKHLLLAIERLSMHEE